MNRRTRSKINAANAAKSNGGTRHGEFWTERRIETLRIMWADDYLAVTIAALIGNGCTRCMVIGKANRLGLNPRKDKKWRNWRERAAA